jgi:hypothetical protein
LGADVVPIKAQEFNVGALIKRAYLSLSVN